MSLDKGITEFVSSFITEVLQEVGDEVLELLIDVVEAKIRRGFVKRSKPHAILDDSHRCNGITSRGNRCLKNGVVNGYCIVHIKKVNVEEFVM